jgi:hypothetical protein
MDIDFLSLTELALLLVWRFINRIISDLSHSSCCKQSLYLPCSVIVEALKMDSLQRLCSSLEPILRRVVRTLCRNYSSSTNASIPLFG